MEKLITLILCLLLSNTLLGGTDERQHTNVDTANYLDYYHAIAAAEEAVVNTDYANAVTQYQKIFKGYPYNNPIDCYIAAQAASYIDDTASCSDFLYKGLCFGLPVRTIAGNPHLKDCFQKMAQQTVDSCLNTYRQRIDQTARARMLAISRYDQSFIQSLPIGEIYDYSADSCRLKNKYQPVWDSLINEVVTLIRTSGFPAQRVIGTQDGVDSSFPLGPLSTFVLFVFVHHSNAWPLVSNLLWDELLKGNITPQMYGVIYESSNGKREYRTPINYFASRGCWQRKCKGLIKNHLREINEARWSIGLGKYEVMDKKFESRILYYKWRRKETRVKEPFFDFQCDLSFQRQP